MINKETLLNIEQQADSVLSAETNESLSTWLNNKRQKQNLQQCNVIVALPPMYQLFKDWCKETGRNGGVIVGQSIREFCEYADAKLKQDIGGNA